MVDKIPIELPLAALGVGGYVADAAEIQTAGGGRVQTDLTNLLAAVLHWKFNATVIDATNPGATFLSFNNGAKDLTTIISFNTTSNVGNARFDEFLTRLGNNDGIFLQQRNTPTKSILFRVTGKPELDGTKVNVPVARQRDQGGEFTNDTELNILFLPKGGGTAFAILEPTITIDATNPTTFATSLQGVNVNVGHAFEVTTAGEPFAGARTNVGVGDVIASISSTASLTDIGHWVILRRPDHNLGTGSTPSTDLTSLENKVAILYPLSADVQILVDWAAIYDPARPSQVVEESPGYTLMADWRGPGADENYESAEVSQGTATDVVTYSDLKDDLHRCFGFKVSAPAQVDTVTLTGTSGTANINVDGTNYLATFNTDLTTTASDFVTTHATALDTEGITVTSNAAVLTFTAKVGGTAFTTAAPVNATGDLAGTLDNVTEGKTLFWLDDNPTLIPLFDARVNGTYRVNHFTPARTQDEVVTDHLVSASQTSGPTTLTVGGAAAVFTMPAYPADTTNQSRVAELQLNVFKNGVDTLAGGGFDGSEIIIPDDVSAQALRRVSHTFNLGFPDFQRVTATFGYEFRVSGQDLLCDVTLIQAPSGITFTFNNFSTFQSYTASIVIPRVDNWLVLQDAAGDYTFTGENELLVAFHPYDESNTMNVVPVARSSNGVVTQLNDALISEPTPTFDFIQVPDDIEFRTFLPDHFLNHSDLAHLVTRQDTKWVYGLALEHTVTGHAITEAIDLHQDSTLNGKEFSRDISGTAISGTGNEILTLPDDYTSFEMIFGNVTEDGGQTMHYMGSTRHLEANETLASVRIAGNDQAAWDRTNRTITLHETADTWEEVLLLFPRQS